jgi:hypothetical protein
VVLRGSDQSGRQARRGVVEWRMDPPRRFASPSDGRDFQRS